jgi:hypothetical protein
MDKQLKAAEVREGVKRVNTLLASNETSRLQLGQYSFGKQRTYEQYLEYAGVNPYTRKQATGKVRSESHS